METIREATSIFERSVIYQTVSCILFNLVLRPCYLRLEVWHRVLVVILSAYFVRGVTALLWRSEVFGFVGSEKTTSFGFHPSKYLSFLRLL